MKEIEARRLILKALKSIFASVPDNDLNKIAKALQNLTYREQINEFVDADNFLLAISTIPFKEILYH